jgi:hypothetical protein
MESTSSSAIRGIAVIVVIALVALIAIGVAGCGSSATQSAKPAEATAGAVPPPPAGQPAQQAPGGILAPAGKAQGAVQQLNDQTQQTEQDAGGQ